MFLYFTNPAKLTLAGANREALRAGSECITTAHILIGISGVTDGAGAKALDRFGAGRARLRLEADKLLKTSGTAVATGNVPMSPRANAAVQAGIDVGRARGCESVGSADLLTGLLRDGNSVAVQALLNLGLALDALEAAAIAEAAAADEAWASPLWAKPK